MLARSYQLLSFSFLFLEGQGQVNNNPKTCLLPGVTGKVYPRKNLSGRETKLLPSSSSLEMVQLGKEKERKEESRRQETKVNGMASGLSFLLPLKDRWMENINVMFLYQQLFSIHSRDSFWKQSLFKIWIKNLFPKRIRKKEWMMNRWFLFHFNSSSSSFSKKDQRISLKSSSMSYELEKSSPKDDSLPLAFAVFNRWPAP